MCALLLAYCLKISLLFLKVLADDPTPVFCVSPLYRAALEAGLKPVTYRGGEQKKGKSNTSGKESRDERLTLRNKPNKGLASCLVGCLA